MKLLIKCKTTGILALILLSALLCAGLQTALAAENTLTMSIGEMGDLGTDPTLYKTLIPGLAGLQDYHYYTHFSPLITLDGDSNIIPWMAESYEVSDDLKTITFHLRKGIKFADGTPLNSSILKFNFDRMLTYGLKEKFGNQTKANIFVNFDYCEAPDDLKFKIHFTKGWLDMANEFALNHIYGNFISPNDVNPARDIKGILKPEKMFNGLGPYDVDRSGSVSKQKVVLKRRHSWRDDYDFHKPKLDKIVLTYIADPQTAVMALEKGEIDYICRYWNAPLDALVKLEKNPMISIKTSPETRMYYVITAYWKEPFNGTDGIMLRKAICYALNRTEIVDGAFNGYAKPATDSMGLSPLRPDVPGCCRKGYDYDLEKAKQLLSQAGWNDTDGDGVLDKNGKALKNLDFVITSGSNLIWQKDLAVVVQSQLKKIGIDVNIRVLEPGEFTKTFETGDYDLKMSYNMGRVFPLTQEISGYNLKDVYGIYLNHYGNQNGTLESAATNIQKTTRKEERDRYVCQVCDILYDEAGIVPLVYEEQYAVMNSKVKGFEFGPSKNCYYLDHIENCWIEE
jgi:peptide/nickel transport system substrate-binding protein